MKVKLLEKYGLNEKELKELIALFLEKLATDEEFYKRYLEKMKEKIEKNEIVYPARLIIELLFQK